MMAPMALTQKVKTELAAVATPHPNARRAEVATMLRFGGGVPTPLVRTRDTSR